MPRKDQGWITFQTSEEERRLLEEICQRSQRTKTEVLREMLRGLKYSTSAEPDEPVTQSQRKPTRQQIRPDSADGETALQRAGDFSCPAKSLKVSSRNVLEGRVKHIVKGSIHTEVTLEIVHRVELTSTITTTSAERLELEEGKPAYAVIKSSDVVIAME